MPIVSLRTAGVVGHTTNIIINPNKFNIDGWHCLDKFSKHSLVLLSRDIRDFVPQGIAVDDHDAMTDPEDLIRLQEIIAINYNPLGKIVVTDRKRRIGKVSDYSIDTAAFKIQKLLVNRPVYKSFSEGHISIDRNQILEINDKQIIIRDTDIKSQAVVPKAVLATS